MERVQIKGSSVMCSGSAAERANLEEEVAGDGRRAMCGVGIDHKRHRKGSKEESTKKSKGDVVAGVGAMCGVGVGVGVDHKGHRKASKKEERTKKPKGDVVMEPNGDEVMEEMLVADAGSKERGGKMRRKKKKRVVAWWAPHLQEDVVIREIVGYMVCEPEIHPSHYWGFTDDVLVDTDTDARIAGHFREHSEYDADVIRQFRTNVYADLKLEPTDHKEELKHELMEVEKELKHELMEIEEELTAELVA